MLRTVFFVVVLLLAIVSSTSARTWPVPSAECPTIQAGIDSASVGDTVLVAAGTYTSDGNKNLDFGGTDLVLLSEGGPELTIIDCEGSGRGFHFHSGEIGAAVVEGFTITNGNVGSDHGGGMLCDASSPTVRSCVFSGNTAQRGGGMRCQNASSPTIGSCIFFGNLATAGGGMHCRESSPTVTGCTFSGNYVGGAAGGMYCGPGSSPTVINCTFSGNSADYSTGGGMYCTFSPYYFPPTVSNCTFSGNSAVWGGGLGCDVSSPMISDCTFSGNSVDDRGGAIFCYDSSPTVNHCTFFENSALEGAGVDCFEFSRPLVENTIIAFSPVGEAIYCVSGSGVTLTCCDVYGNAGGDWVGCIADQLGINGNFSACPSFCNVAGGDFHLCDESPCAPGNHPDGYDCGLIGAWPVGCSCGPSRAEGTTWGRMKAMYR